MTGKILVFRRAAIERLWRVVDAHTQLELMRGTRDEALRYAAAFGRCYAEEVA
jgi:hypothetical protein